MAHWTHARRKQQARRMRKMIRNGVINVHARYKKGPRVGLNRPKARVLPPNTLNSTDVCDAYVKGVRDGVRLGLDADVHRA